MSVKHVLDVRGRICPYPLALTKKKMMELEVGEQLEVLLDYAPSLETIPRWAASAGHWVVHIQQWSILLEKGPSPAGRGEGHDACLPCRS